MEACPHSSFVVPGVSDDGPPRESLEVRMIVISNAERIEED